jgi:hypothetical protein
MLSSSLEKELREIFASVPLKCKATYCRNDSSMRAIRYGSCFRPDERGAVELTRSSILPMQGDTAVMNSNFSAFETT